MWLLSIHIFIAYSNSVYNTEAILFGFYIQISTFSVIVVPGTYLV